MKTKDKQALRLRTLQELKTIFKEAKEALFLLRLDKSQNKLKNIRSFFWKRKEVTQVLTAIREKELQNVKNI